jgi:hypothetical protein
MVFAAQRQPPMYNKYKKSARFIWIAASYSALFAAILVLAGCHHSGSGGGGY